MRGPRPRPRPRSIREAHSINPTSSTPRQSLSPEHAIDCCNDAEVDDHLVWPALAALWWANTGCCGTLVGLYRLLPHHDGLTLFVMTQWNGNASCYGTMAWWWKSVMTLPYGWYGCTGGYDAHFGLCRLSWHHHGHYWFLWHYEKITKIGKPACQYLICVNGTVMETARSIWQWNGAL